MRRNFKTVITASLLVGCMTLQAFVVPFISNINVNASDKMMLTAGVSAALGQQLFVGRIENENENLESVVAKNEDFATGSTLAVLDANGETTICGYYNIGISKADPNLNIRKKPSMSGEIVGKLPLNAACEILEEQDGWAKIKSGNAEGWVSMDYLITGDEAILKAESLAKEVATVTTSLLYVREQPNTDCNKISSVAKDEQLIVLDEVNGWYKVELDNETGWVCGDYVTVSYELPKGATISELRYGAGVSQERVDLVNFALQFVGGKYVWGGESLTKGVDCSGFTMKVYEKFGIKIPHYSVSQSNCGTRISASQAKPGDLFFYSNGSRINHVAIYIGNGKIVHASSPTNGIIISNAYYRTPVCVVNLFGD